MHQQADRVVVTFEATAVLPEARYVAFIKPVDTTRFSVRVWGTDQQIGLITLLPTESDLYVRASWSTPGGSLGPGYATVMRTDEYRTLANVSGVSRWVSVQRYDTYQQERFHERIEHVSLLMFGLILASIFLRSWTSKREVL